MQDGNVEALPPEQSCACSARQQEKFRYFIGHYAATAASGERKRGSPPPAGDGFLHAG
jgi:hypothetical protein